LAEDEAESRRWKAESRKLKAEKAAIPSAFSTSPVELRA
jgi:hypothetical protein